MSKSEKNNISQLTHSTLNLKKLTSAAANLKSSTQIVKGPAAERRPDKEFYKRFLDHF